MKYFLFFALLFLSSISAVSQTNNSELPQVISPSPEVSNLMRFEEVSVNEYNGKPNISLPLFSKKVHQNLNFDLSLNYNTDGLRIKQYSGALGTGWSMFSGGTISRAVVGKPDEDALFGIYENDGLLNWDNISSEDKAELSWNVINGTNGLTVDSSLDIYQFNFMGRMGRFIIVKEAANSYNVKFLSNDKKIKVEFEKDNNNAIDSFKLTDEYGYVYLFSNFDVSTTTTASSSVGQFSGSSASSSPNSVSYFRSAWHLTKVISPNNVDLLEFDYIDVLENYTTESAIVTKDLINKHLIVTTDLNKSFYEPRLTSSSSSTFGETKKISNINFVNQNTTISFVYEDTHPEIESVVLKSLVVNKGNTVHEQFNINTSSTNTTTGKRLFLDGYEHIRGAEKMNYDLEYYQKGNFPGYSSTKKDLFGYHRSSLPTKLNDIKAGVLTKIKYPTGGYKEFDFESGTYSFKGNEILNPRDIEENTIWKSSGALNWDFYLYEDPQITDYKIIYINQDNTETKIAIDQFNYDPVFQDEIDNFKIKLTSLTLKSQYQSQFDPNCYNQGGLCPEFGDLSYFNTPTTQNTVDYSVTNQDLTLSSGFYLIEFDSSSGFFAPDSSGHFNILFSVQWKDFKLNQRFAYGGGLVIKTIKSYDENDSLKDEINYDYNLLWNQNEYASTSNLISNEFLIEDSYPLSSGSIDYKFNYLDEYTTQSRSITLTKVFNGQGYDAFYGVSPFNQYIVKNRTGHSHVNPTKSGVLGFKNIAKYQLGNGKVISEYTSPMDFPTYPHDYSYPFTQEKDVSEKQGLLISQRIYNENRDILKRVSNINKDGNLSYDFIEEEVFENRNFFIPEGGTCPYTSLYSSYTSYMNLQPDEVDPEDNVIFNEGSGNCNQSVIIGNESYYSTKTIARLKESIITDYFYDESDNQKELTRKEFYDYNDYNNQLSVKATQFKDDSDGSSSSPSLGFGSKYLATYYHYPNSSSFLSPFLTNDELTALQRLNELHVLNEIVVTREVKDDEIISNSINTFKEFSPNQVLPSKLKTLKGELNSSVNNLDTRIEYLKYDNLGNPLEMKISSGTHVTYIWGYNKQYPVAKIENLTYAQVENLPSFGSDFTIPNNLSSQQEQELRSLNNVMVTTYTYLPDIGISSMTDPRGYTTTYHYDEFHRLKYVKDEDENILTKNEYNYSQD